MEKGSGQRDPLKTRKLAISQNQKKCINFFIIIFQPLKFHRHRLSTFQEIRCAISVRKIRNDRVRATSRSSVRFAPKIPSYVILDLDNDRIRFKS